MQWVYCDPDGPSVVPIADATLLEIAPILLDLARPPGEVQESGPHDPTSPDDPTRDAVVYTLWRCLLKDPPALAAVLANLPILPADTAADLADIPAAFSAGLPSAPTEPLSATFPGSPAPNTGTQASEQSPKQPNSPGKSLSVRVLSAFSAFLSGTQDRPTLRLSSREKATHNQQQSTKASCWREVRRVLVLREIALALARRRPASVRDLIRLLTATGCLVRLVPDHGAAIAETIVERLDLQQAPGFTEASQILQTCEQWLKQIPTSDLGVLPQGSQFSPGDIASECSPTYPDGLASPYEPANSCDIFAAQSSMSQSGMPQAEGDLSAAVQRAIKLAWRWRRSLPQCRAIWETACSAAGCLMRLSRNFCQALEEAKLAALAEFAAGAGHEINNPLAVIAGHAQLLLRHTEEPEARRMLATIVAQSQRAHEMIADARLFARPPQPTWSPVDFREILETVAADYRPLAEERKVRLELGLPADVPSTCGVSERSYLLVALGAICKNALEAVSATTGRVTLALLTQPESIHFIVGDNGPGLSPEQRRHLFEPFYSGRQAGRGLGMGLSKAWRLIQILGGRLEVTSAPGAGTQVHVIVPRMRPDQPASAS